LHPPAISDKRLFNTNKEGAVTEENKPPFGQRLMEKPIVLLVLGLVVMFAFYTVWGLVEILSLPEATLP
jgi:hypothetical protein